MKALVTSGTNGMEKGVAKVLASVDNQIHEIVGSFEIQVSKANSFILEKSSLPVKR